MCTLMVLHRRHPEFWLVAAANRDERLDRPSTGPEVLREDTRALGGKDLAAGGTWLGVNAHRVFVAVTNRGAAGSDPARRSRGLLVLDALGLTTVDEVAHYAENVALEHNPFNLLALSPDAGVVMEAGRERVATRPVEPGPVAITNGKPNDRGIPNVARGMELLEELAAAPAQEAIRRLADACADHRQEDPSHPPFCLHRDPFGTVSSTILLLREDGTGHYLFAPGPPCATPYEDYSHLLARLR